MERTAVKSMAAERRPNHLAGEKSPYLIQHAYNPVGWYPWGEEALQKAKTEDKPIFLSIGYSTCHWCHVMEHESFEDKDIAAMLNEKFVPIKVDREERPDLDEVYMRSVMSMNGQGGWPLSVFLTPDLKPFYGGTYFPNTPRHGMPSFPQILTFVADVWKDKREEITKNSEEIIRAVQQSYELQTRETLSKSTLDSAYAEIVSSMDDQFGGFSIAPKFPLPNYLEFLMRYFRRTRKEPALRAVRKTLQAMAAGGIHDQVGGGFHRYSTDRFWLVPHFEKMLYDNAQLARVYLEAYQLTSDRSFLETAEDTLGWLLREMRSPDGGFYSAQDADTEDGEGFYYTWTPAETAKALEQGASRFVDDFYGITAEGNFEAERSILHVAMPIDKVAAKYGLDEGASKKLLEDTKSALLASRARRARPATDDKVIASWNGLAISAFAYAYQVTGEARYLEVAQGAASFITKSLVRDGTLLRRYRDGEAAFEGGLEDYAFVAASLLDLYETTFQPYWLKESIRLTEKMVKLFSDDADGFRSTSGPALVKVKDAYDGPTPSGNSVAALMLLRLSDLTGREDFRLKAEGTMKAFGDVLESSPFSHTYMLSALDFWFGSKEIVVSGDLNDETTKNALAEIWSRFLPNKVLAVPSPDTPEIAALTEGKVPIGGKLAVYICENFACRSPVTDLPELRAQLES